MKAEKSLRETLDLLRDKVSKDFKDMTFINVFESWVAKRTNYS